ncbi:MAG: disulfide bond formation protein B [Gammaproteobacteria bacterium]|nr:disulfide bond formation protein B [Gammaproteobacteria bacterium]
MSVRPSFRLLAALGFLASAGSMALALYLQYGKGEEPCPLCVFQRVAMIATGAVFLLASLHGPRGAGRWVYAGLAALTAAAGAGMAARHVWLQSLPPDQVPACGPTLDYLLKMMPWQKVMAYVLRGEGSCAVVNSTLFGVSLPKWTLAGFTLLTAWALLAGWVGRRRPARTGGAVV